MGVDASCRKMVSLAAVIALTSACTASAVAVRDPSADGPVRGEQRAPLRVAEGAAETQPAETEAPTTGPAPAPAPQPATQAERPATQTEGTDGSDAHHDPHFMRRVLGWVALSVGAEAAVIAVVTTGMIEHQKSIRDDNCNAQKVCSQAGFDAAGTISTLTPWNTATWFVAAAGLGVGTLLVLISPPENPKRTAITLSPESSGLELGVRSTF